MFNRHIQAGEHRQHIRPPGSAAAPFGVQRVADFTGELPPVEETQPLDQVDMGLEGPVDDYSYSTASRTAVSLDAFEQEGYDAWHRDEPAAPAANKMVMDALEGVPVGDSSTIEIMKAFSRGFERGRQEMMDREFPEMKGASRSAGWVLDDLAEAAGLSQSLGNGWSVLQTNGGGPVLFREFNDYDSGKVSPPDSSGVWNWSVHARLYQVNVGSGAANTADEAMSMVEQTYAEYKRTASKTAAVTWYDHSDQFGGLWATHQGSAPDSPNGMINESGGGMYRWYVSDSGTRGNQQTGEVSSLEEAKRQAEQALASLGFTASRRTAFLDTVELAEPRHRVAGWDWDDHLNGFIAAEAAREFTCACGDNVPAPGYTDCRCGKRWNAYAISANGSKKMIAREVPVRENVVMARTASRRTAETIDSENLQVGDVVKYGDETITIIGEQEYWEDPFGRDMMKYMARSSDGREGYVMFGYGASLPVVASTRTASRKTAAGWNKGTHPDISDLSDEQLQDFIDNVQESIDAGANVGEIMKNKRDRFEEELRSRGRKATRKIAAPSSGADAVAQYFPGWIVDDDDGDFWEVQSPGREHAFIHEGNGVYTLLMDDNTPDEFWETGLSFEDALAEVRAEGII